MSFIVTVASMSTHLYNEYSTEISRGDDTKMQFAIDRAIAQAKGYCSRYELPALFGAANAEATIVDPQLQGIIKDLALWHFIQLGNTNIEFGRAQAAYEYAIQWLRDVQLGRVMPEGWPYLNAATLPTAPEGNTVSWSSNKKRRNHY